jgi:hypothetical protein
MLSVLNSPTFYRTWMLTSVFSCVWHWPLVWGMWINHTHSIHTSSKIHVNGIAELCFGLLNALFLTSAIRAAHFIHLEFIILIISHTEYKSWTYSLCTFFLPFCYFNPFSSIWRFCVFLLDSYDFAQTIISNNIGKKLLSPIQFQTLFSWTFLVYSKAK